MNNPIKILHLEDDPMDAELVREMIASENIASTISRVQTREEFTKSLKKGEYDLILSDYKLPMFDGISAMRMAEECCPEIPFIFVSGALGEDAAIETLTCGATDYVLKSKLTRLAPAVKRAIEEQKNKRESERIEKMMQVRLRILEAAYTKELSLDEICIMVLDEIESQTESEIGFFVFVKEDQRTVILQSWSSNTTASMSTAEGKGRQYDISEEGVWTDCINEKKPLIHNDYPSSSHQKALPEGHAPLRRELVIPIIRGDLIVACIGVGNKGSEYDETDIQIVSLLGDFSWEIIRRKRAEEDLKTSEERYRMVFENSPVSIWEEDFSGVKEILDGLREEGVTNLEDHLVRHPEVVRLCAEKVKVLDVNNAALDLHRASKKEELLSSLTNTFTPESFDTFRQELVCLYNGEMEYSSDAVVKTLSGDTRHVTLYFSVSPGHEKTCAKVLLSIIDITDRKLAGEALKESEERYRSLVEFSPEAIIVHINGKIIYGNAAAAKLYGGETPGQFIGRHVLEFIHPEYRKIVRERTRKNNKTRTEEVRLEEKHIRLDGQPIDTEVTIVPIAFSGKPATLLIIEDITERKKAEKLIIRERENFYKILATAPVGILLIDGDMVIQQANKTIGSIVLREPAEIIGKRAGGGLGCINSLDDPRGCSFALPCSHCPLMSELKTLITGGKGIHGKEISLTLLINGKPQERWLNVNIEPVKIDKAIFLIVAMDDITKKKELEKDNLANLHFLEGLDRINRAMQGANDLEEMMSSVLEVLLSLFKCDGAWLVNPCDPESETWQVVMERTNPEYPPVNKQDVIQMDSEVAQFFRQLLDADGPVQFGPKNGQRPLPAIRGRSSRARSSMAIAIYPKVGKPMEFGMDQCSHPHIWTADEERLFQEIGRRLADSLTTLLMYREVKTLLRELHHRTKNNMAVIVSLLEIQSRYSDDSRWRQLLVDAQGRIRSMALVHQKLYDTKELSRINLKHYINELIAILMSSYNLSTGRISLVTEMDDVFVEIDYAVPCGLVLNELITNALKYAFPHDRKGIIKIQLQRTEDGEVFFSVADDGIGVPPGFDFKQEGRMGTEIVYGLTESQLKGHIKFEASQGIKCQIVFSDNLYRKRI